MEIKIGINGLIEEGNDKGWYVRIEDDSMNTGGYLILIFDSLILRPANGFDYWVDNWKSLELFFKESGWTIKWLN
jgi:hypothetical protein